MPLTQKQYQNALSYQGAAVQSTVDVSSEASDQQKAVEQVKSLMEKQKSLSCKLFEVEFSCRTKPRLFISEEGLLGQFSKGAKKWGSPVLGNYTITKIVTYAANADDANVLKHQAQIRCVAKYMEQAKKAEFSNRFIRKCLNANPLCSAFENGLSSGNKIEGKLVSVRSLAKHCEQYFGIDLVSEIAGRKNLRTGRFPYQGYEGSIQLKLDESGDYHGWFNCEFKGCGNGYYYLLINNDHFIGYDID